MATAEVDESGDEPDLAGRSLVLTTRGTVLAVTLAALVVLLAFPLHQLVAQRGQIAALQRQKLAQEQAVAALAAQQQQLQDPAYVQEQARARLGYVLPGQQNITVLDPSATPSAVPAQPRVAPVGNGDRPWWERILTSADLAGTAPLVVADPTPSEPAPSPRPIPSRSALPTPGPATSAPKPSSPTPSSPTPSSPTPPSASPSP